MWTLGLESWNVASKSIRSRSPLLQLEHRLGLYLIRNPAVLIYHLNGSIVSGSPASGTNSPPVLSADSISCRGDAMCNKQNDNDQASMTDTHAAVHQRLQVSSKPQLVIC